MPYWLLKTEPSEYAFADLRRDRKTAWTGIKNAAARLHLRAMKPGDELLIYHTGGEKAVVGRATVATAPYPDGPDKNAVAVDIAAGAPLPAPVTLAAIKADPRLKNWALVKIGRLSVVPTTRDEFNAVLALAKK